MNTKGDRYQTKEPKNFIVFMPNEDIQPTSQQLTNIAKEPKPLK
jgi:hypothetical protein